MEKLRRKRINNSLEQLRVLLPYSANMKKDMASLLEQTVEYINIMHTVLNEDKPACLNKVYLSYREKTEQIERFRKNFKKNVNKRSQSDAGCSWSQPYASFGQQITDTEPYIKHPCMNNPYYETNTMGNQMWQQQKITESFLSNPVNFSGSNQNQFFATQPSNLPPRSIYYPPPTKQPDVTLPTNLRLSDETTNSKSVLPPPASKFESWQPVHSSTTEQVCSKAPSSLPNNVDWHHPTFNPTGQLFSKYGLSGKFQIGFYDENNNNTTLCEESVVKTVVEPKQHIPCNQTQDVQENPKVPNPINSDTNIKISTPAKPGAVPEMYFNQETTSTASNIYGGGSTWPPLPPLTLNQNNFLSTQAQMSPRKENNENKKSNSKED